MMREEQKGANALKKFDEIFPPSTPAPAGNEVPVAEEPKEEKPKTLLPSL